MRSPYASTHSSWEGTEQEEVPGKVSSFGLWLQLLVLLLLSKATQVLLVSRRSQVLPPPSLTSRCCSSQDPAPALREQLLLVFPLLLRLASPASQRGPIKVQIQNQVLVPVQIPVVFSTNIPQALEGCVCVSYFS